MGEEPIIRLAREIKIYLDDPYEVYNESFIEDFISYCVDNLSKLAEGHYLVAWALFRIYYDKSLQSRNSYS